MVRVNRSTFDQANSEVSYENPWQREQYRVRLIKH